MGLGLSLGLRLGLGLKHGFCLQVSTIFGGLSHTTKKWFYLVPSDGVDLMVEKKIVKKINYPAIKIKFSYINKI